MMNESECCCRVIERKLTLWLKNNHKDLKKSAKCWICQKQYKDENFKIKDHCHITGKYRDCTQNKCYTKNNRKT